MAFCSSAMIASLWRPSPSAINELWKRWPSTRPRTLTSPRVPKYSADPGITTYVQPPLLGLFCRVAVNCLFSFIASPSFRRLCPWASGFDKFQAVAVPVPEGEHRRDS